MTCNCLEQPIKCDYCNKWIELEDGNPVWDDVDATSTNVIICDDCYEETDQADKNLEQAGIMLRDIL